MSTNSRPRYISDYLAESLRKLLADPTEREQAERMLRVYDANHRKDVEERAAIASKHEIRIGTRDFANRKQLHAAAKTAGFNGSYDSLVTRLRLNPQITWEDLIKPVDATLSERHKQSYQRRKTDMVGTLAEMNARRVPADFPVRPITTGQLPRTACTCGTCHLSWDDAIATSYTPAPSGRCPFEAFHP